MISTPEQKILLQLMMAMSAADRQVRDAELSAIGDIARSLPVFKGIDQDNMEEASVSTMELLAKGNGIEDLLDMVAKTLPEQLYPTAYALAVEISASDHKAAQEELQLLEMLSDRLGIDPLMRAAIEASARVRYRHLPR